MQKNPGEDIYMIFSKYMKLSNCIFLLISHLLIASTGNVIMNPKSNLYEKRFTPLEVVKSIGSDLGNNAYLFKPTSMSSDIKGQIYVYDILQGKILKFDKDLNYMKSFGNIGTGPGEFSGYGKFNPVFIKVGNDEKLYAHDLKSHRIIVFNLLGEFLREYKYKKMINRNPIVDHKGNIYFFSFEKTRISAYDKDGVKMITIPFEADFLKYLFFIPGPEYTNVASAAPYRDIIIDIGKDSSILVYFQTSSTLLKFEKKSHFHRKIWPEKALNNYKKELEELIIKFPNSYKSMFTNLIQDASNTRAYYFHFGADRLSGTNRLYQYTLDEGIKNVYYIASSDNFCRFLIADYDRIYGIQGDKVVLFKIPRRRKDEKI